jgi:hypothetical protein
MNMALPKLSDADKMAALNAATPVISSTLANKNSDGKPWLLADKKTKIAYPARLDGDIAAKLEFIYQRADGRPSKNSLINKAVEEFTDQWLKENGYT